jgi:hypothetical protein
MAINPYHVRLKFSAAVASPGLVGASWTDVGGFTYEIVRGSAAPEAFVDALRCLGELPTFEGAASGDSVFDGQSWLDYVAPHRRPWL